MHSLHLRIQINKFYANVFGWVNENLIEQQKSIHQFL